jgi:replicative DNA helicase
MDISLSIFDKFVEYALVVSILVNLGLTIKIRLYTNKIESTNKNVSNSTIYTVNGNFIQTIEDLKMVAGPAFDNTVESLEEKSQKFEENDLFAESLAQYKLNESPAMTGFESLDKKMGVLENGNLIVISAIPSDGRTTLALDICRYNSLTQKIPVILFSLGMHSEVIVQRLIGAESRISVQNIREGTMQEAEFESLDATFEKLNKAPIFIDDNSYENIEEIRSRILKIKNCINRGLIIIDGVELLDEYNTDLNLILRILKRTALEVKLPIIITTPLSRDPLLSRGGQVRLSDLPEVFAQISDTVIAINPPNRNLERPEIKILNILKNRYGLLGTTELYHDQKYLTFLNIAQDTSDLSRSQDF